MTKPVIFIAAFLALALGVIFGNLNQHDHSIHAGMSHEEYEAKKVKPESVKDLSFLLEVELSDTQGNQFKVAEKLGKLNLVNYWATWCAPCREEMPLFNSMYEINKDKGFVVLGLTREEAVLGLLSQAAVQANPGAMVHAAVLHQKFHTEFEKS